MDGKLLNIYIIKILKIQVWINLLKKYMYSLVVQYVSKIKFIFVFNLKPISLKYLILKFRL